MPNYITHVVMGNLIDIPDSRVDLDRKKLSTFSVGHDLMMAERGALDVTHNTKTKHFFFTLIDYIKENKLYDDPDVMAFLYGHIMHYELDKIAHPYIYYMTNGISQSRIVNFHMASEEYLGSFVMKNRVSLSRKDIASNFNSIYAVKENSNVGRVINDVYDDVYGYFDSLSTIKQTATYIKALEVLKTLLKEENSSFYYSLIGFYHYLEKADMDVETLTNERKEIWCDPISKRRKDSSFLELFDESIAISQDVIKCVNSVIYGGKDISCLESVFSDDSYDTGISCEIGKPFAKSRYCDLKKGVRN